MKNFTRVLILFSVFICSAQAVEQIEVQALMPGMVVLKIDGERITLKTGEESPQGVKMISADTREAVLQIGGEQKSYTMGTTVSTHFTQRESMTEQVIMDDSGMFRSHGSINGHSVEYLVDTGATSVSMSARDARKLGIQYRLDGIPIRSHTASGMANGWRIQLKSVRLGQLVEYNVQGVVVDGDYPQYVLLGMSFLNRMKVTKEGNKMIITQKQ